MTAGETGSPAATPTAVRTAAPTADRTVASGRSEPAFAVVAGRATDEDVAVLAAMLAAMTAGSATRGPAAADTSASSWHDRRALLRRPVATGPNAWRFSAFPS